MPAPAQPGLLRRAATVAALLVLALRTGASGGFEDDCRALTRAAHRLTGTDAYRAAAEHVERRLREIGADDVIVQEFPTTQTAVRRCVIEIAGTGALELEPMRPNGIIPPVSPPQGLAGPLYHAGAGRLDDFGTRSPAGAIVVLDYNAGAGWLRAFRLGAKAVVFVRSGLSHAWHPHYVDANANLPRFYYPGRRDDLPDGATATIHSEVAWQPAAGRHVLGFFRGTDPIFEQGKDELILVAANLDSFGEIPRRTPAARGAANCAALLALAQHLRDHRPRRHTLLAFLDAQARGHLGSSAFYRALEQDDKLVRLATRQAHLENERRFLEQLDQLLGHDRPLLEGSPVRRELMDRLKRKAAARAYDLGAELYDLRIQAAEDGGDAAAKATLSERIDARQAEKDRWNDLRRAVVHDRITEAVRPELNAVLDEVRRDVEVRSQELEAEGRSLECDGRLKELIGGCWISLHVSLLLGDATARWGLVIGGDSVVHSPQDDPGLYGKVQGTFLAGFEGLEAAGSAPAGFERASADGTLDPPRLLWAAPFLVHSGEVAGRLGIYNLAIGTVQENLAREGTPDDTLDALDVARIEQQASELGPLLVAVAGHEGLSLKRSITTDKLYVATEFTADNRLHGPMAMGRFLGSAMPDRPVPGAVVQLTLRPRGVSPYGDLPYRTRRLYAFDDFQVLRTNRNGSYGYGPVVKDLNLQQGFAVEFDDRGLARSASDLTSGKTVDTRLNLFACLHGVAVLPPLLAYRPAQVLRARANSSLDDGRSHSVTLDGVVSWYCEDKVEGIKLFGLHALAALNTGPEDLDGDAEGQPEGVGFATGGNELLPASARRSAVDLWRLNESRMEVLRDRGIMSSSIEELHGRAEDLLRASGRAPSVASAEAMAAAAFMAERPVYENTRAMLDDLVHAVLVLLALSVPFAFALERLLIGATNIYRQIGWFAALFVLTFLVLYVSHPAFAISKTPIVIFLGFAVVVLSALVIVIILRRFRTELKVLQGLTSTVHAADVSRIGTVMAAMSMGISTMRRRPLRTALTATTIIMLTFTILCFASFGTKTGIVRLFVGPSPGYAGAFLHQVTWAELNADILDVIRGRWGREATVCRRSWVSPRTQQAQGPLITREDGTGPLALRGVLGLDAEEIARRPDLASLLAVTPEDWGRTVLMTRAMAERLGVSPGDVVLVGGLPLAVGALLDASGLSAARDMDGNGILPVDFVATQSAMTVTVQTALTGQSEENWAYLPTDSVVVVSAGNAEVMGAALHAVALYAPDVPSATALCEDLARIFPLPVSATRRDGVYRHVLGTLVQASGAGDLLFPVLLGGLVIFGTMLGSVADRQKEIYAFSSLGLAPPHVASLFFAEAMVYSVLGGLAGYLIAQGSMAGLSWLAEFGLVRVPEMNYSSTNAIVTILIVMGTVLVSAIYPAIQASRSANPGIMRTWRLPAPEGDRFDIVFPFTVSAWDITGVVSFLKEHFDNFGDTGLGVFMAKNARLARGPGDAIGLDADVALAPFDLGVTQAFSLRSAPSEIPGIDEVTIQLVRTSGQPRDWRRLNRVLLNDLRRQFLIWRSLPQETMDLYRQRTLTTMGGQEQP